MVLRQRRHVCRALDGVPGAKLLVQGIPQCQVIVVLPAFVGCLRRREGSEGEPMCRNACFLAQFGDHAGKLACPLAAGGRGQPAIQREPAGALGPRDRQLYPAVADVTAEHPVKVVPDFEQNRCPAGAALRAARDPDYPRLLQDLHYRRYGRLGQAGRTRKLGPRYPACAAYHLHDNFCVHGANMLQPRWRRLLCNHPSRYVRELSAVAQNHYTLDRILGQ